MKKRLSFKQRRILAGYLFSLPFLLGFTLFFSILLFRPLFSVLMSW